VFGLEWRHRADLSSGADRLAASLAAGSGRACGQTSDSFGTLAQLMSHSDHRRARAWRPVRIGPLTVLLHGFIDNAAAIAAELGHPVPAPGDSDALARLYGAALLAWGPGTDRRLIGDYATATLDREQSCLRLARSPLRAPPLHYHCGDGRVIAATAVRALFACGIEQRLNDAKLADMAWFNAGDEQRGWFEGVSRVPLGSVVTVTPGGAATEHYYDPGSLPRLPRSSRADYLAEAEALLAEGARAALAGSRKPAVLLSGGLDSSLVAVKALEALPADATLNSYTFTVGPGWDGWCPGGQYGDERPKVEAFCAMHPRIVPHFSDNAGRDFTTRLNELFLTIGAAPQGLANLYPYHALWEAARSDGCDRVLLGEFGNLTASADGNWAYCEYLLKLNWRQLYLALRHVIDDDRPMWRRFVAMALLPLLPDSLWDWQRRIRGAANPYAIASPLRRDFAESSGAVARAAAARLPDPRYPLRDRLAWIKEVHSNTWGEFSDTYSGFEQIHGISQRDPTAYRPFFEFCAGLPSGMFLHNGQSRWLAREMLRGKMPEDARTSRLYGSHGADWHARLSPRREELLREVEALAKVPRHAAIFDLEHARQALEDWPETSDLSLQDWLSRAAAIPRMVIMARFIDYVEGRNAS